VDIKSETQLAEEEAGYADEEWAEGEWVTDDTGSMVWKPADGSESVTAAQWESADKPREEFPLEGETSLDEKPQGSDASTPLGAEQETGA
jgi:hypothetical protein